MTPSADRSCISNGAARAAAFTTASAIESTRVCVDAVVRLLALLISQPDGAIPPGGALHISCRTSAISTGRIVM